MIIINVKIKTRTTGGSLNQLHREGIHEFCFAILKQSKMAYKFRYIKITRVS